MRKRTRRKIWALVDPIKHATEGCAINTDAMLNKLRIGETNALESLRTGTATIEDWALLTGMLNICETMAKNGIGPEALPVCEQAQQALIDMAKRYESTKRIGTTAQGLDLLKQVFEYHDLQRQSISRAEYDRFIKKTNNRIISGAPEVVDVAEVV